jgi:hypothetical protein
MNFSKNETLENPGLEPAAGVSRRFSLKVTRACSDRRTGVPARVRAAEGGARVPGRMAGVVGRW